MTVSEYLDEYVTRYGTLHWGDSYYSVSVHRINDYIKPYIGQLLLKDLTTRDLDDYYAALLEAPAVVLPGSERQRIKLLSLIARQQLDKPAATPI